MTATKNTSNGASEPIITVAGEYCNTFTRKKLKPILKDFRRLILWPAQDLAGATDAAFGILGYCSAYLAHVEPKQAADAVALHLYGIKTETDSVLDVDTHSNDVARALQILLWMADARLSYKRLRRARPQLRQVLRAALIAFLAQDPDLHIVPLKEQVGKLETALYFGKSEDALEAVNDLRELVLPAVRAVAATTFEAHALTQLQGELTINSSYEQSYERLGSGANQAAIDRLEVRLGQLDPSLTADAVAAGWITHRVECLRASLASFARPNHTSGAV